MTEQIPRRGEAGDYYFWIQLYLNKKMDMQITYPSFDSRLITQGESVSVRIIFSSPHPLANDHARSRGHAHVTILLHSAGVTRQPLHGNVVHRQRVDG